MAARRVGRLGASEQPQSRRRAERRGGRRRRRRRRPWLRAAAAHGGRVFQRQGKYAEAEATVASALKRNAEDPLRPDLLFDLGQHQMAQQKFAEAGQSLDQLLREFKEYDQRADAVRHNALCKHRVED